MIPTTTYLGQAEVCDLDVPIFIEQDVARLEVVVDDCTSPTLPFALRNRSTPRHTRDVGEFHNQITVFMLLSGLEREGSSLLHPS